jgi:hypothetical protein
MGWSTTKKLGIDLDTFPGALNPDESATGVLKVINEAHKTGGEMSGKFLSYDGSELAW